MHELVFVLAPGQNRFFYELAETLKFEIERQSIRCHISTTGFPPLEKGRVYVLLPPHEYFALEGYKTTINSRLLKKTIFISAEQPGTIHFENNCRLSHYAGALFDINRSAVREYARHDIHAQLLQLGYSESLDHFSNRGNRTIDVLFIGSYSPRRARILASCERAISSRRSKLVLSDNSGPNSSCSTTFVSGTSKADLLRDSRVLLNIHQTPYPYFEWVRILDAIHCGCLVLTEHSIDYHPLIPGENFLSASSYNLDHLLLAIMEDDEFRVATAESAYEKIRNELPLANSIAKLLDAAEDIDRRTKLKTTSRLRAWLPYLAVNAGLRVDLPSLNKRSIIPPTPYRRDPETAEIRRSLKEVRLDIIEMRRWRAALESGTDSNTINLLHSAPEFERLIRPKVGIIIALYEQRAEVTEALESLLFSTMSDFEVVVVDDGSCDGSADVVRRWATTHPEVPLLLVRHVVNRGLGAARNTAIDFIRAPFFFVLDSDNRLLPNTLIQLSSEMERDHSLAFAYGILAMYRDGKPFGLNSWLPWEPQRLVMGNYIDAMAMFRTDVVRQLGGYSTDRRLYGWEDYDLYCRIAEAKKNGGFVPTIVGWYRVSSSSMRSLSDLSYTSAFTAIKEHCPKLMERVIPPL